jgi:hypothetical protein
MGIGGAIETSKSYGQFVDENDIFQLKYLLSVKETICLHPSTPSLVQHESIESCEVNGYHVDAKIHIFMDIWAILQVDEPMRILKMSILKICWKWD